MKFFNKIGLFVFVFLFCGLLPFFVKADNSQNIIKVPVIIDADLASPHSRWGRPIVIGLTSKNTEVFVYVDGVFSGVAKINESKTATNNFYYQPVEPLTVGDHIITVIAKDKITNGLSVYSQGRTIGVSKLAVPIAFEPNKDIITGYSKPLFKGLTKSGSRVLVYIDGIYNGKTDFITHKSGTGGFVYKPFLALGAGMHSYFVVAETKNGDKSARSEVISFNIEKKYPAPTLVDFKVSKKLVTGLAKNNSQIRIYLDKTIVGEFKVVNHKSGVANFAYTLQRPLTNGRHIVYAISIDERGKESIWSNIKRFYITVVVKKKPIITPKAVSESLIDNKKSDLGNNVPIGNIEKNKEIRTDQVGVVDDNKNNVVTDKILGTTTDSIEKNKEVKNDKAGMVDDNKNGVNIDNILGTTTSEIKATTSAGLFDEQKENQGKLKLNLLVFIGFLLAIIIWIFWVNRELIKEKREKKDISEINKK